MTTGAASTTSRSPANARVRLRRAASLALALSLVACAAQTSRSPTAWDPEASRLFEAANRALDAGDPVQARALMERAAATGEPEALNGLAMFVAGGVGAAPDPIRGRALLEQAVAAGSIGARLNLALQDVDSDDRARQRRAVAVLADLHANPPDVAGRDSVRRIAAGGLARAYLFGNAVDRDVDRGVDLLEEADATGEAELDVLFLLGRTYESGWGDRTPDSVKSYLYFMRAAQLGHAPSQWQVGMALLNESGAKHDEREAYRWVRMSGEGGFLKGQISTAVMLALGQGVTENDVEARSWYERAAAQNSAHALRGLGYMMLTGEGGPRDTARGLAYVRLAADAGEENAIQGLKWSESQASEADRQRAAEISAQWLRDHGKPNIDP